MVKYLMLVALIYTNLSKAQVLGGLDSNQSSIPSHVSEYQPKIAFTATISPGKMLKNGLNTMYLNGYLEYYESSNFSFRGDIFQLVSHSNHVNSFLNPSFLNRITFGLVKNMEIHNNLMYFGIQGGISSCEYLFNMLEASYKWAISPTLASKFGFKLMIWKYAHFYAEASYFYNYINNTSFGRLNLNELIFSGGLGFQL